MIIKQIFTHNNYRNFNYLIGCQKTREAVAIDPLAYKLCLSAAKENDLKIVSVINTHEHFDHTGGNKGIIEQTNATLYAHENAKNTIEGLDVGLKAGDIVMYVCWLEERRMLFFVEIPCLMPGLVIATMVVIH